MATTNEIIILMDDTHLDEYDTEFERYLNENFNDYVLILSETAKEILINAENDAYMVME